jgi:hypothetical protein
MRSQQLVALKSVGLTLIASAVVGVPVLVMCKIAFELNGELSCVIAALAIVVTSIVYAQAVRHKRNASASDRASYTSKPSLEEHREK